MKIAHTIRNILHSTRFQELMRFGIVGVTATLIQYGIYYLCNAVIAMGATTSLTIGYIISFVFNFFFIQLFYFQDTTHSKERTWICSQPLYQLCAANRFPSLIYAHRHTRDVGSHTYVRNRSTHQFLIGAFCS